VARAITFPDATCTLVGKDTIDVFQNKTFGDAAAITKALAFSLSGSTAGATATLTFACATSKVYTFPDWTGYVVLSDCQYLVATGTIAADAVKALNATPVTLIASPGASKMIVIDEVQLFLDWNSAQYDSVGGGDDLQIQYATSNTAIVQIESTGFMDAVADEQRFFKPSAFNAAAGTPGGYDYLANGVNEAIELTVLVGELYAAAGDSPLKYKIRYHVIDILT
jgi:hypothetical protein